MSDAMSRAREIAAKLRGGFSDTGPPPEKRRRGGFSDGPPAGKPHLADIAAAAAAAVRERLSGGPPQPKQSQGGDHYGPGRSTHIAEPAVALPTAQKFLFTDEPGMEFELKELHVALACSAQPITSTKIFTPEDGLTNYMGLVLGPKGSSLKQMQEKYRCKIVVRGRGIQRGGAFDPDPSPDDDLPMHVSVTGPQDAVQFLEKEYHAMFTNAEKRREVKQRQMDTMVSGETAGTQLALRDGALVVASSSGDNWRVIPSAPRPGEKTYEARVPNGMVGLVIGRGGENIKRLNLDFGVRVQVAKEAEPRKTPDAVETRRIAITGTPEGIDRAKKDLSEMIKTRKANGGWSTGPCAKTLVVDNSKIGLIIGKGGLTVKGIQERSGANVAIPSEADTDNPLKRTLTITGQTDEAVREASVEIENMLRNHDLSNGFDASDSLWGPPTPVPVPEGCVGLIIGKGGETIQRLQQGTGAKIQIPNDPQPGSDPPMRVILVAGLPQQRQNAHYEIQLLVEQHNQRNPQYLGSSRDGRPLRGIPNARAGRLLPGLLELRGVCGRCLNRISRAVDATRLLDGVLPRRWYGEEAARQTYGAYAPPVGSQPPAAEPAVPGVEPAAPGVAAPAPAAAAGAQTYGAAPLTYAPDYAAAPPGVTPPPAPPAPARVMAWNGSPPAALKRTWRGARAVAAAASRTCRPG